MVQYVIFTQLQKTEQMSHLEMYEYVRVHGGKVFYKSSIQRIR
jgi:hypothetical protein